MPGAKDYSPLRIRTETVPFMSLSTLREIRTHTEQILSLLSLPIGLEGLVLAFYHKYVDDDNWSKQHHTSLFPL